MSEVLRAIAAHAREQGDAPALISDATTLSYRGLCRQVDALASDLTAYQGQCAGIELDNGFAWVLLDLACIKAGIVTVPLPAFFTTAQRQHALRSAGASLLFSHKPGGPTSVPAGNGHVITIHILDNPDVELPVATSKITYTSGTTGEPKGVCLSQAGMEQVAASLMSVIGPQAAEKTAAVLPLAVLLENIAGCYATLLAGGCYDVQPQTKIGFNQGMIPNFVQLHHYLRESAARSCILVPELLRGLIQVIAQGGQGLAEMRFIAVGGSRVSASLLQQAEQLGLPVYQGYGLSEAASVMSVNTPTANRCGTVGKLLPHVDIHLAGDGEIWVRTPGFLGYVGESLTDDVYPTGDIGALDAQGFLHITGRKKNIIINAMGRNIAPEWPESELLAQPQIAQAVVFGDAEAGLSALLVPSAPTVDAVQLNEAIARANQALPEYAQVRYWQISPPFTVANKQLTGTGRPRRAAILEAYQTPLNNMYSVA
ncbi:AMP-binding protein [Sulfuriflexus mobilis]|uniref:AMP-binding protein n=1 Tax=Sulfuriflexus mobilis TaxID=1811807 RepID=UPI000F84285B|nr:AMP-binding protein [Sulfuriflexus mobilis]